MNNCNIGIIILCIEILAQVSLTNVFLFNLHPISIFPKDSVFMPSLYTHAPLSFDVTVAAPFPMILILKVIYNNVSYAFYTVMMSQKSKPSALFLAAVNPSVDQSHEIRNKLRA